MSLGQSGLHGRTLSQKKRLFSISAYPYKKKYKRDKPENFVIGVLWEGEGVEGIWDGVALL
jgi:hypothetical protein